MTKFVAIKVHYDHRKQLPTHLKYSVPPTAEEYKTYLDLFANGVGGDGFHECMNFTIPDHGYVPFYLPPTCIPKESAFDEEYVFFTFTYKGDHELPASIVGVHANASLLGSEGLNRTDVTLDFLEVNLLYHAIAKSDFVTLFTVPVTYDYKIGTHSPTYKSWGYGLRYLEEQHARKIIVDAYDAARKMLGQQGDTEALVTARELGVLSAIHGRYFGSALELPRETPGNPLTNPPEPDPEVGKLGEHVIYERELAYASEHGIPSHNIEWISQAAPTSVYDIRSARIQNGEVVPHYIEVKSSRMALGENIVISKRQIDFLSSHAHSASVVLVSFHLDELEPQVVDYAANDFVERFEFTPLKYRVVLRE